MIRGGTSRGLYFMRDDLPAEASARDELIVRALGGPDALQIDGVGGGHPLTSKVAVLHPADDADIDIDYLFLQVDAVKQTVSSVQNCGNILAGVGLYAVAHKLVKVVDPVTTVRIRMLNSGAFCHLEVLTPGGEIQTEGDTNIDGVPGTAAPIVCNYLGISGSACGALLPTGNVTDEIEGVHVACVDNGMPVVTLLAEDVGVTGRESPEELDANVSLRTRLEAIRLQAGPLMNLGDVQDKSVPKMCLISPAQAGGLMMTRTFIPHVCHKTIGVLGAVSAATACLLPDGHIGAVADAPEGNPKTVAVEHPAGSLQIQLQLDEDGNVQTAGVVRTGRILFEGEIHV